MKPAPYIQEQAADRKRALAAANVAPEAVEKLDAFVALLNTWQATTNLIAPSTLASVWTRHILDSLQLLSLAPHAKIWVDLGSGGGFPGLVIACVLKAPGIVHLVESNAKKAAFLREAARVTGGPAKIHNLRIEDFIQQFQGPADVVTARALAPLPELLGLAAPFLEMGGQALLLKGQDIDAELTEAAKCWKIEADLKPSMTDPSARIMVVRSLERIA